MKRQIRKGVFESNSSSMHSLSIQCIGAGESKLSVDRNTNKVYTKFGEFGWGYDVYTDATTKLSYLMTMLVETHNDCYSVEELYETEDFQKINEVVMRHCNCDGIIIDEEITQECLDGKYYEYNDHRGYIDHQSVCSINDLCEDLCELSCTLEEFIFDTGVELVIDNDNSPYGYNGDW